MSFQENLHLSNIEKDKNYYDLREINYKNYKYKKITNSSLVTEKNVLKTTRNRIINGKNLTKLETFYEEYNKPMIERILENNDLKKKYKNKNFLISLNPPKKSFFDENISIKINLKRLSEEIQNKNFDHPPLNYWNSPFKSFSRNSVENNIKSK